MNFFWNNKLLSIIIICIIAYILINPSNKFGINQKNFVIYNRIPITFFDIYISPNGSLKIYEDIYKKEILEDIIKSLVEYKKENNISIIIGSGFLKRSLILKDEDLASIESKGIQVNQLSSKEAIKLYNQNVKKNNIAILLRIRD
jgi:hypothetical protein